MPTDRARRLARLLQAVILGIAVVVALFLALKVLDGFLGSDSSAVGGRQARTMRELTPSAVARSGVTADNEDDAAQVQFDLRGLDQVRNVLLADMLVRVPAASFEPRSGCPGDEVIDRVDTSALVFPALANSAIVVILEGALFGDTQVEVPISSLHEAGGALEAVVPVSIPTLQSGNFPQDRQEADVNIDVRLSTNLWNAGSAQVGCVGSSLPAPDLPFEVTAVDSMDGFTVRSLNLSDSSLVFPPLAFEVHRSLSSRGFVYAMLVVPVLLLGAALATVIARGRHPTDPDSTFGLELAFGVLSLIALRSVLVPSDVPGVTLVDWILGLELVLFVILAVGAALYQSDRRPTRVPTDQEPGTTSGPEPDERGSSPHARGPVA
jgi:hypothetical protein